TALVAGAGGVAARGAKDRGAGVLASCTLAALAGTFAAVGAGVKTGATGLGARTFLPSLVEFPGAFFSGGVAGEESSAALLCAGELLVFLMFSFTEFIFVFT